MTPLSTMDAAAHRPEWPGVEDAPLEVAVVGLGPVGREIARVLHRKPWARIVAAVDVDPDLEDRDVGDLCDLGEALGVRVSPSLDAACDAAVHATVSSLERALPQVEPLLRRGITVVSTCEELSFPLSDPLASVLDEAAMEGGGTLLGTGINPGFLLDTLPATLTVVCQEVEHVEAVRVVDAGERREPLQRKVGAGMDTESWTTLRDRGEIRHVGLPESARMLAAAIGWDDVTFTEETIRPVIADREVTTEYLTVREGQVAGVRQEIRGARDGNEVLRLELAMYVGAVEPRDAVTIRGLPPVEMEIAGGVHGDLATAAVVANMLPRALAAEPGLVTMADLPLGAVV